MNQILSLPPFRCFNKKNLPKSLTQQLPGSEWFTPLKINMEHNSLEVWKMIFLSKWVIYRFHVELWGGVVPTNAEKNAMDVSRNHLRKCLFIGRRTKEMSSGTPHFFGHRFPGPGTLPFQGSKFGDIEEWRTCRKQYICVISRLCVCILSISAFLLLTSVLDKIYKKT